MELTKEQQEILAKDPVYKAGMENTDPMGVKWLLDHPHIDLRGFPNIEIGNAAKTVGDICKYLEKVIEELKEGETEGENWKLTEWFEN